MDPNSVDGIMTYISKMTQDLAIVTIEYRYEIEVKEFKSVVSTSIESINMVN